MSIPKFNEAKLSSPTPGPSSRPTRLSLSSFQNPHPYNNLGQITAAHGSSIVTTKFSSFLLKAAFLQKLSSTPAMKTNRKT
ncbi:hypothetical protein TNCV_2565161 [Trichonephila clavipes]|uniref:Uncharacterized protein n=1 Tax=Trichonephila clavipes TaxID=2585209 RepID=A0A8X6SP73_TRICX|nr:hypothetical protein TNCV_2565161 [Trichonephila clavipes]